MISLFLNINLSAEIEKLVAGTIVFGTAVDDIQIAEREVFNAALSKLHELPGQLSRAICYQTLIGQESNVRSCNYNEL
jgi:hypothetical protein